MIRRATYDGSMNARRRGVLAALIVFVATSGGLAYAQVTPAYHPCGPVAVPGHYGPYDYVTDQARLDIVERVHFTPEIESFAAYARDPNRQGENLSYTLNAFPNHHRALYAIVKLGARTKDPHPQGMRISIECFFDRATRFRPKDTVVRGLFAIYLAQIKRKPEAITQLDAAVFYAGDNAISHHNIGLVYLELGSFDAARQQAYAARKLGYESTALIDRLKAAKQWREPQE